MFEPMTEEGTVMKGQNSVRVACRWLFIFPDQATQRPAACRKQLYSKHFRHLPELRSALSAFIAPVPA